MKQQTFNDISKCCYACGGDLYGYWQPLNPGICDALVNFYRQTIETGKTSLHLQEDIDFSKNQFANFQKLKNFALVRQTPKKSGYWEITDKGLKFLCENLAVNSRVRIFRNQVMERSPEMITICGALKCEPYWLQKEDYVKA